MLTTGAPPVKMFFEKVGSEGKEKVRDALFKIIKERFGNGPITLTNKATLGVGRKS